jgi:hypothetical protein
LSVGLKVDADALPAALVAALKAGKVDLKDPAVTVELLRLNAVVGVQGTVRAGVLTSIGITCAFCHSTVDNSFARGIGKRLDGWANTDLNVGAIVALSPALNEATKVTLRSWGPGRYDPRLQAFDGEKVISLNSTSLPVVIPPIYGLKGIGFETFTGDGPISYWNTYVGVGQMGGQGSFSDPRIGLTIKQRPERVAPRLAALLDYQLTLLAPAAPSDVASRASIRRGERVFATEARCASCHRAPLYTDVMDGPSPTVPLLHAAAETGTDPRYAERTATKKYRTTPLRGLLQHPPYFHDGSAATLEAVVERYDRHFNLKLSPVQKADLVAFLKTL